MLPLAERSPDVAGLLVTVGIFLVMLVLMYIFLPKAIKRQNERFDRMARSVEGVERQLGRIADAMEKSKDRKE